MQMCVWLGQLLISCYSNQVVQKGFLELTKWCTRQTKWCTRQTKWCAPLQKGLSENTDQLFSVSLLYEAINLFVCLPFFFCSPPHLYLSLCLQSVYIYICMCHTKYKCRYTFLSALLTCVSFCNMSSVSGITSVIHFILCSSSENYFPGHFARCTAWLLNLDCKYY